MTRALLLATVSGLVVLGAGPLEAASCSKVNESYVCTGTWTRKVTLDDDPSNLLNFGTIGSKDDSSRVEGDDNGQWVLNGAQSSALTPLVTSGDTLSAAEAANVLVVRESDASRASLFARTTLSGGDDTFLNMGTVRGQTRLGDGDDVLAIGARAGQTSDVSTGAGDDMVSILGTLAGDVSLGDGDTSEVVLVGANAPDTATEDALVQVLTYTLGGGTPAGNTVAVADELSTWFATLPVLDADNQGRIRGSITGGSASESIFNFGAVTEGVDFATGNEALLANGRGAGIGGTVTLSGVTGDSTLLNLGTVVGSIASGSGSTFIGNLGDREGLDDALAAGDFPMADTTQWDLLFADPSDAAFAGTLRGGVAGGSGDETVFNLGSIGGGVDFGSGGQATLRNGRDATVGGGVDLSGTDGEGTLLNLGTVAGGVTLGAGATFIGNVGARDGLQDAVTAGDFSTAETTQRSLLFADPTDAAFSATLNGGVTGGSGDETVFNLGSLGGGVDFGSGGQATLRNGRGATVSGGVDMSGTDGDGTILNLGTVAGGVTLGAGSTVLLNPVGVTGLQSAVEGGIESPLDNSALMTALFVDPAGPAYAALVGNRTTPDYYGVVSGDVTLGTGDASVFNTGVITGSVVGSASDSATDGDILVFNGGQLRGGVSTPADAARVLVVNVGTLGTADAGNTLVPRGEVNFFLNGNRREAFQEAFLSLAQDQDVAPVKALLDDGYPAGGGGEVNADYQGGENPDTVINLGVINGDVVTGSGDDTVGNSGQINGTVTLGAGDDRLLVGLASEVTRAEGGDGTDTLAVQGTSRFEVLLDEDVYTGFETVTGGTLTSLSQFTSGDNVTINRPLLGNLVYGDGDNRVTLTEGGSVGGTLNGGEGTNTLVLEGQGILGAKVTNFETLTVQDTRTGRQTADTAPSRRWRLEDNVTVQQVAVRSGDLAVNEMLRGPDQGAANVAVAANASLSGIGTIIGRVTLAEGSFLRPGNSIGTQTVRGNMTQEGTYVVEINPTAAADSQNDLLVIDGDGKSLTIESTASVHATPEDGMTLTASDFDDSNSYTIVEAINGATISGEYGSVSDDFAFLYPELSYTSTAVTLTLARNLDVPGMSVAELAAVNEVLESENTSNTLRTGMVNASTTDTETWSGDLGTVALSGTGTVQRMMGDGLSVSLRGMRAALAAPTGVNTGDAMAERTTGGVLRRGGVWLAPEGYMGSTKAKGGVPGFDTTAWGLAGGVDMAVGTRGAVGLALGFADTRLDSDRAGDRLDLKSYQVGIYGTVLHNGSWLEGAVTYTRHHFDSARTVTAGAAVGSATTDYDGDEYGLHLAGGHDIQAGAWTVTPELGVDLSSLNRGAFTESVSGGLGGLALTANSTTYNSGQARLEAAVSRSFQGGGWTVTPTARLGVAQGFGDTEGTYQARFVNATTPFTVQGADYANTTALAGLGLEMERGSMALFADYNGSYNRDQTGHQLTLGVKVHW